MTTKQKTLEQVEPQSAAKRAGRLIKLLRKEERLTQTQLGERMGLSQARVSQLEKGEGPYGPSLGTLCKAGAACGYELRLQFVAN